MLTYENVGLKFKNRWIFQNLSGQIAPGEMVGIMGPNGSGKSSFLRCLAHLMTPSTGSVLWEGKTLDVYTPEELSRFRSYARADVTCQWDLTVEEVLHLYGPISALRILEILALVKGEFLLGKQFNHLSGGERSLVLLALSLIHNPSLILLDEITAMLDETYAQHTMQVLRQQTKASKSVAIILHDRALVEKYCHRIINFFSFPL
jgi:iron complex transport system ATP-binding protein